MTELQRRQTTFRSLPPVFVFGSLLFVNDGLRTNGRNKQQCQRYHCVTATNRKLRVCATPKPSLRSDEDFTTRRTTSKKHRDQMNQHTIDESDAESFHSAISSVTRTKSRCQPTMNGDRPTKTSRCRRYTLQISQERNATLKARSPSEQPGASNESGQNTPRVYSSQSRHRPNQLAIPRRQSSSNLDRKKRRKSVRKDPATLHRESCQLFSSLDGMLALSREFTPLPSVSTTRTGTRHGSLIVEETETIHRLCRKVDERLNSVEHEPFYSCRRRSASSLPISQPNYSASTLQYHSRVTPRISISTSDMRSHGPRDSTSVGTGERPDRPPLNTVISWTSDASRRQEYERIDRAHSGVRGMFSKMLPKCMHSKNKRRAFFTGDSDCDGDSVRRFRMSLDDTDGADDEPVVEEKTEGSVLDAFSEKQLRSGQKGLKDGPEPTAKTGTDAMKRWWTCFQ